MNYKKSIFIILFFIILFLGFFLIQNNDNIIEDIDNISNNTNISKNSSNISNTSTNTNNTSNVIKNNVSNHISYSKNRHNSIQVNKSKIKSNQITDDDIIKIVKKGVIWDDGHGGHTKNVNIGKPYKSKNGMWLVPAFDKKTGKFLGAVWVGSNDGGFFGGVDSYSEYKEIISYDKIKKSHDSKNKTKNDKKINNKNNMPINTTKDIKISKNLDKLSISYNSYQAQSIESDVRMNVSS